MKMNKNRIKEIIPHREPFLLVDEVSDLSVGKSIVTHFFVDPAMAIFQGHFPSEPVLPGVYTVECMAQSADILIMSNEKYANLIPLFIGIDKVKFREKIKPSDRIEIHVSLESEREDKGIISCIGNVFNEGKLACEGVVTLAMR